MSELVFVKLGGSLITDKSRPYAVRQDVIDRLAAEIFAARRERGAELRLLVGHGGGSFPHVSAKEYQTARGTVHPRAWEGFVKVHDDAVRLNTILCEAMNRAGATAMTMQPSAAAITRGGRIVAWPTAPIEALLSAGVIPVPYGDVCIDEVQGCSIISTEEILRHLAGVLRPARILLVGKVDGVLDAAGAVIPRIDHAALSRLDTEALASDGMADVTGGMRHKLESALEMGAPVDILSGLVPGRLLDALRGVATLGTRVEP